MFEQFYSKNHGVGDKYNDMHPLESLASFQNFLQSLRECTNEMFNN